MSRRHAAEKRDILPDAKYGDLVLTKFMNSLMRQGKKSVAEGIVYGAFDKIEKKTGQNPLKMFHEALDNVKPQLEVRSRRVGGATYQIPIEVRPDRSQALAIRWLIGVSRKLEGAGGSTQHVDRLTQFEFHHGSYFRTLNQGDGVDIETGGS